MRTLGLAPLVLAFAVAGCPGPAPELDAGEDAGPYDGGSCTSDEACDDHRFCNGTERCVMGSCARGEAVVCPDDGIACTTERCSERRAACESTPVDADGDGDGALGCADGEDCDDADPTRFSGNFEVCDAEGHDEDCDPATLGGLDEDGDGFVSVGCCNDGVCGDDCDDARPTVSPTGLEVCNDLDDDCSGAIDEGTLTTAYEDRDRDGFGTGPAVMRCGDAAGFAREPGDCDDTPGPGLARNPGQPELCDGVDNDCDGRMDEAAGPVAWFPDDDGDGFGAAGSVPILSCAPLEGRSLRATDCDDAAASVGPGSAERCNGRDDDCNGRADFSLRPGDLEDDDGDGSPDLGCGAPVGTDCDDGSALVGPAGAELCDGRDNDCDDAIDEDASTAIFFRDLDGDGYGSEASGTLVACGAGSGFVGRGGDCDDDDPARSPGAAERCDGGDDDCDASIDESPAALACSLPNATSATCRDGACVALACSAGFGSCGRGACEDVLSNAANCGACGRRCTGAHVVGASMCVTGECTIPRCEDGYDDCNGEGPDGCETLLAFSNLHCGGCGRRCPAGANQTATCTIGTCGVTCVAGYYDCNGRIDDGCERSAPCAACSPGTVDCDGSGACEDPLTDASHCGGCDRSCGPAGSCLAGSCDRVVEVVTGAAHTCVRREGGGVACWGAAPAGPGSRVPTPVALPGPATDLASTRDTVCATVGQAVYCWGGDDEGQLGNDAALVGSATPVRVTGLPDAVYRLAAGADHVVAYAGLVWAWGSNASQQIAFSGTRYPTPTTVTLDAPGTLAVVAAGDTFTCGFLDVLSFATDVIGGACRGTLRGSGAASIPFGMGTFYVRDLSATGFAGATTHAGDGFVCADVLGSTVCAGDPMTHPAIGMMPGTVLDRFIGAGISGRLGGGRDVTCAIGGLGAVRCHGGNAYSQLGAAGPASFVGVPPSGLPRVEVISDGHGDHVCAVDGPGRVWCWGRNDMGQCGAPPTAGTLPVRVDGL